MGCPSSLLLAMAQVDKRLVCRAWAHIGVLLCFVRGCWRFNKNWDHLLYFGSQAFRGWRCYILLSTLGLNPTNRYLGFINANALRTLGCIILTKVVEKSLAVFTGEAILKNNYCKIWSWLDRLWTPSWPFPIWPYCSFWHLLPLDNAFYTEQLNT